jgi:hypothetical protein
MLELLKRFEQDNLDDPFAHPENSDGDEGLVDDLERRLAGIDLGELYHLCYRLGNDARSL